ncbi:MAG TPA: chloride channel protein [Sphingomonas sp.]|uniref:chloride channel protein n=1 Tax=Sphingomonas sp. TaxID=28214 RepID=UPI002C68B656|nr:chloride channel protein [Sphingomonas sp.]HMI18699.1 chloride channel protein [Sphingomonas sp.]
MQVSAHVQRYGRKGFAWGRWLRQRVRSSEFFFILLAIVVGMGAGLLTILQGIVAWLLQHMLFGLTDDTRLSGAPPLTWFQLAILPLGGLILAFFTWGVQARKRTLVDAVEANALHGGRMSVWDSLVVAGQTILSNGFGASVGLEAAYAQMGGVVASRAGRWLEMRRGDMRTLVGAGAGAAIAAAFGSPLAGAFYAFEVVIGAYTPAAIAPVAAASLAGAQVAQRLGGVPYVVTVNPGPAIHTAGYLIYAGLGLACALIGILIMQGVAVVEERSRAWLPHWSRPAIGGLLLVPIAFLSPQVLSAGHSALHIDIIATVPIAFLALILAAKCLASIVSLGFGFRGGLFFASLFLGTLAGHLYAAAAEWMVGHPVLDSGNAAMVGMAALATAVVGAPITMAMLVLGATGNFSLTGAVLAASLVSSTIVRETFGYSFSTWRLHLRGQTIKSARDVGWVRTLTAGRMMRGEVKKVEQGVAASEFRRRFPLGSSSRVAVVDGEDRYIGIVTPAAVFDEGVAPDTPVETLARVREYWLAPQMHIGEVMTRFDQAESDELVILDPDRRILGILTESFVRRRYADELEKAQRDLFGER